MKLSDFLQYPEIGPEEDADEGADESNEVSLRLLKAPRISDPLAEVLIQMLIEANSVTQVLEVLHLAFKEYREDNFIMDVENCETTDFWDRVFDDL